MNVDVQKAPSLKKGSSIAGSVEEGQGYRFNRNGWIYVHIEGDPHGRGYQHGNLVAPELKEILGSLKYLI